MFLVPFFNHKTFDPKQVEESTQCFKQEKTKVDYWMRSSTLWLIHTLLCCPPHHTHTHTGTESSVHRLWEPGVSPLLERKACSASHLSWARWLNEPVLYWEPTRWMEPLHLCCTGARWRCCTACLFDSLPSPTAPPYGYHQGSAENTELVSSFTIPAAYFI